MKRKKLTIVLIIILVLMSTVFATKAFAANSFSTSLTPNILKVVKGEQVTVTIKLSKINVEGGISALSAVLKYDHDVLSLEKNDVKGVGDWVASYEQDTDKILFDRADEITKEQDIGTITFTVKASTSAKNTAIQLSTIAGANASLEDAVKIADITTNIQITVPVTTTPSPTDLPTESPTPSQSPTNTPTPSQSPSQTPSQSPSQSPIQTQNTITPTNGAGKNTTSNEVMPNTGTENYVVPLMAVIAILAIISFVNYKRLSEK